MASLVSISERNNYRDKCREYARCMRELAAEVEAYNPWFDGVTCLYDVIERLRGRKSLLDAKYRGHLMERIREGFGMSSVTFQAQNTGKAALVAKLHEAAEYFDRRYAEPREEAKPKKVGA